MKNRIFLLIKMMFFVLVLAPSHFCFAPKICYEMRIGDTAHYMYETYDNKRLAAYDDEQKLYMQTVMAYIPFALSNEKVQKEMKIYTQEAYNYEKAVRAKKDSKEISVLKCRFFECFQCDGKRNFVELTFFFQFVAPRHNLVHTMQLIITEAPNVIFASSVRGALKTAIDENKPAVVQLLARNKAINQHFDVNTIETCFCDAVRQNFSDTVKVFITSESMLQFLRYCIVDFALRDAVVKGWYDMVEILIPAKSYSFVEPLNLAVEKGFTSIVRLFINTRHSNNNLYYQDLSVALNTAKHPEIRKIIKNEMCRRRICCCCHSCTIL